MTDVTRLEPDCLYLINSGENYEKIAVYSGTALVARADASYSFDLSMDRKVFSYVDTDGTLWRVTAAGATAITSGVERAILSDGGDAAAFQTAEGGVYLLADTGGHYLQGTTDITRTIPLGPLTEEERRAYTVVLKGHLRLGAARFPEGLCGQNLDILARLPLWEQGMDYNHGTGHGVGYVLSVHEGPQRLHWRLPENQKVTALAEGMVVSNEPGYYAAGQFGIRHENLELVQRDGENEYGRFLHFEPLTMVPFDRTALELSLLSEEELALLNAYHEKVRAAIAPHLDGEELAWLMAATAPILR